MLQIIFLIVFCLHLLVAPMINFLPALDHDLNQDLAEQDTPFTKTKLEHRTWSVTK